MNIFLTIILCEKNKFILKCHYTTLGDNNINKILQINYVYCGKPLLNKVGVQV